MPTPQQISASVDIDATPEQVWTLGRPCPVSDPSARRPRRILAAAMAAVLLWVLALPDAIAADAPVRDIIAPLQDINVNTTHLKGGARVEESPRQVRVRLDGTVLFAKDSPRLLPGARARLVQVASRLKAKHPGRVRIVGYTGDLGSAEHG